MEFAFPAPIDQGAAWARVCTEVRDGRGRDSPRQPDSIAWTGPSEAGESGIVRISLLACKPHV